MELISNGWTVALYWVPSYVGIPSNERADKKAKQGAESSQPEVPLMLKKVKSIISTYFDKYRVSGLKVSKSYGLLLRSYPSECKKLFIRELENTPRLFGHGTISRTCPH
ncbi:hypothetical protein TNCV_559531 [Trichonephila clavipes]|nr:hypothetical protein TNCV_559531 [Trichonephila clavipes]